MTDEKLDENDEDRVDQYNAGTLNQPRKDDEGGDDQLNPVPDA
jgi:hypothetical protein